MSDKLPPKILVIESITDNSISTAIRRNIERYWFDIISATPANAIELATLKAPNIIIISAFLKSIFAIELTSKIREINKLENIPIIFLTQEEDPSPNYFRNKNFEILRYPFRNNGDLVTVIRALLRKSHAVFEDKIKTYKDVSIDVATFKVSRAGKQIRLGPTEFKILLVFMQSPKVIFSRQNIINHVWGPDDKIEDRTVDVHVNRLRKSMESNGQPLIKTVRSKGYCFSLPGEIDN